MSIAAGQGTPVGGEAFLPDEAFARVFGIMRRLWPLRPEGTERLNPIAFSEVMARGDLALVPLVFGYVTYARAQAGRAALALASASPGAAIPRRSCSATSPTR